ncbi:MAG: hypothetical protein ACLFOY_05600 [Desulfatibacillaceae bacterium]
MADSPTAAVLAGLACIVVVLLCAGCVGPPRLDPLPAGPGACDQLCGGAFAQKPFRVVHTIDVEGPFGVRSSLVGVTVGFPESRDLRAMLLSVEGPTLFDAVYADGEVRVNKAAPPMDREGFAEALLSDVRFLLFGPKKPVEECGVEPQGRFVCRYPTSGGGVVDVVRQGDAHEVAEYGSSGTTVREFRTGGAGPEGFGKKARLTRHVGGTYTLRLVLVSAETLDAGRELLDK